MKTVTISPKIEKHLSKTKQAGLVFRAVNHQLRRQILTYLHENKRRDVRQIYRGMGLEQSVASNHLAILRKVGIVNAEREGQHVYYSVNYKRVEELELIADRLLTYKEDVITRGAGPKRKGRWD